MIAAAGQDGIEEPDIFVRQLLRRFGWKERIEAVNGNDTAPYRENSLGSPLRVRHRNACRDDITEFCLKTPQYERVFARRGVSHDRANARPGPCWWTFVP